MSEYAKEKNLKKLVKFSPQEQIAADDSEVLYFAGQSQHEQDSINKAQRMTGETIAPAEDLDALYAKHAPEEDLDSLYAQYAPKANNAVSVTRNGKTLESSNNPLNPAFYNDMSLSNVPQNLGNLVAGGVRGAGSIGASLMLPIDAAKAAIAGTGITGAQANNSNRRKSMDAGLKTMGADPNSGLYKTGKIGTEILGTADLGAVLGAAAKVGNATPEIINLLRSGGFGGGGAAKFFSADTAKRAAAGATLAGTQGALVDPENAGSYAAMGGMLPVGVRAAGEIGKALKNTVFGEVSKPVKDLYVKAKKLGIDIPADRIANSKPMNAVGSSLNYIPMSGRAGVEQKMEDQLNKALSKTFGQDSSNVTMALRNAKTDLGAKFDSTLKNNGVAFDKTFLNDITATQNDAASVLVGDQLLKINKQIDNISSKVTNGTIDGQAAYNIKKQLDTLSNSSDSEVAKYARDLRDNLMDALNRSLGKNKASEFAITRKQWGNMRSLEKLAQNGADGGISVGRLANMKNIGNQELQDLADISAQFVRTRENPHGAAQRVFGAGGLLGAGLLGGGVTGAITALPVGMVAGRSVNSALNSNSLKNLLLSNPSNGISQTKQQLLKQVPLTLNYLNNRASQQ